MTVSLQQIDEGFYTYLQCETFDTNKIRSTALTLTGSVKPRVFIGVPPATELQTDRAFPSVHIRRLTIRPDFERHEEVEFLYDDDGLEDPDPTLVYKKSDVPYCGEYVIEAWTRTPEQDRELETILLAYFPSYGELPTATDTLDFNRLNRGNTDDSVVFKDQQTFVKIIYIEVHFEVDGRITETVPAITSIYTSTENDDSRTLLQTEEELVVE